MNYLLINSHPYDKSFTVSAVQAIRETVTKQGNSSEMIDLIDDRFNPVMYSEDLQKWGQGTYHDELVGRYMEKITAADVLVFVFPVWWGTMPAVLKGFCDKVLLPGWAYKYGENGEMIGLLTGKKAVVITTMQTPSPVYDEYFNNPVVGGFIKDTLQTCGVEVAKHMQIDNIVSGGRAYTDEKLAEILLHFEQ